MERLIKFNDKAKCGNVISPDDSSNTNYLVERVLIDVTRRSIVIVIQCKCGRLSFLELPIPSVIKETRVICFELRRNV